MSAKNSILLTFVILLLAGCVNTATIVNPDPYRAIAIPAKWSDQAVVALSHSTDLRFEIHEDGNRVIRKDILWYRVKNRNKRGLEYCALHWSKNFEKQLRIEAQAFYPDGSDWTLAKSEIQSDKDPYSNSVSESFRIPAYDDGVIIRIVTDREYIQPEFYGSYLFSGSYPVLNRSLSLHLPEKSNILYGMTAADTISIDSKESRKEKYITYTVTATDLEPVKEKWQTHYPEQYYPALNVSFPPKGNTSYTWQELGDHYLELSKSAFEVTESIQELSRTIDIGKGQSLVAKIFDEVVKRVRYQGDWNGEFAFFPRAAKVVLANGYGDCKELATILKTLLKSRQQDAYFVLLSTWNNFQAIEKYPSLDNFNHAILAVPDNNDTYHYLDPTHSWANSETSYYVSIGRKAFVLRDGASHLTTIEPRSSFHNSVETFTRIHQDEKSGKWKADGTIDLTGYTALRFYEKYHYSDETDDSVFMRSFLRRYFDIHASDVDYKKLTPNHVVLEYSSPFQNQYLSMGDGGFKLSSPFVHKSYMNDSYEERFGATHKLPFEQIDRWQLPYIPSQSQLNTFTSVIGTGSWRTNGSTLSRKYSQKELLMESTSDEYVSWYNNNNAFMRSSVWR
jgi:hypothetical protein